MVRSRRVRVGGNQSVVFSFFPSPRNHKSKLASEVRNFASYKRMVYRIRACRSPILR